MLDNVSVSRRKNILSSSSDMYLKTLRRSWHKYSYIFWAENISDLSSKDVACIRLDKIDMQICIRIGNDERVLINDRFNNVEIVSYGKYEVEISKTNQIFGAVEDRDAISVVVNGYVDPVRILENGNELR